MAAKYFIYFHCDIIPNTLETFVSTVLGKLRSDLVQKSGGQHLSTALEKMLSRINSFFSDYLKAVHEYAEGQGTGSRDDYLAKQLDLPLKAICQEFTGTALQEFLPEVSFFRSWRKSSIPAVDFFAKLVTWLPEKVLNRIMRSFLTSEIPSVVQSIVKMTFHETQPNHLLFAVSATRAIMGQLQTFKNELGASGASPESAVKSPAILGGGQLPEVVENLMSILKLEPYKTRNALHARLHQNLIRKVYEEGFFSGAIQEGAIDGVRTVLAYLSDPDHSEELFYHLLHLSSAPFDRPPPQTQEGWQKLRDEYNALQTEMKNEAREIFSMVINRAVRKKLFGLPPEQLEQIGLTFCAEQQVRVREMVKELRTSVQTIHDKIRASQDILPDLDQALEEIDYLENTSSLPGALQIGIEQALRPVRRHLELLHASIDRVRRIQEQLLKDDGIASVLSEVSNAIDRGMTSWPRMEAALTLAHAKVPVDSIYAKQFDGYLLSLKKVSQTLEQEEKRIQSLYTLGTKGGPLSQLFKAVRSRIVGEEMAAAQWKDAYAKIDVFVKLLPDSDKKQLTALISSLSTLKDEEELNKKWAELKGQMQGFLLAHSDLKDQAQAQMRKEVDAVSQWTNERLKPLTLSIKSGKEALAKESLAMSKIVESIDQAGRVIHPTETLGNRVIHALGGRLPIAVAAAAGVLGGLIAAYRNPAGGRLAILGAAALTAAAGDVIVKKIGLPFGIYLASARATSQVLQIFDQLYDFAILGPHVGKWVVPAALDLLNESYRQK
jgi:hypothetical protein